MVSILEFLSSIPWLLVFPLSKGKLILSATVVLILLLPLMFCVLISQFSGNPPPFFRPILSVKDIYGKDIGRP